ncbi:hypothetical protein Tco_0861238 [Tanacetum coccineum]|uniref:Uncharacterized protein n=1 Tax=Tanacetum coccineum TaxID=301880 RepID=A0ABQ5BH77_9ASTR
MHVAPLGGVTWPSNDWGLCKVRGTVAGRGADTSVRGTVAVRGVSTRYCSDDGWTNQRVTRGTGVCQSEARALKGLISVEWSRDAGLILGLGAFRVGLDTVRIWTRDEPAFLWGIRGSRWLYVRRVRLTWTRSYVDFT